ncbi:hypothetical protein U9M48_007415 [Paspalum notatum var. saurae]|uniref:diphthine methyl ester synthase n=1 Tax=Paspalum notatum var. saurae TaxID=547442 RepID=A0AAQ3SL45_PASNO
MLYIVGLGLGDERDITVRGLDAVRSCSKIYMEAYTSLLSLGLDPAALANLVRLPFSLFSWPPTTRSSKCLCVACPQLLLTGVVVFSCVCVQEKLYGKEITVADREMVEERVDQVLSEAADADVAFLVVGDPFGATTHTDLVVRAKKMGAEVKVIHNASVMNAIGVCGLQLYRYGETISIPFFTEEWRPDSFYEKIQNNRQLGLHTLCLLDIRVKEPTWESLARGKKVYEPPRFMTVNTAISQLFEVEEVRGGSAYGRDTLCIGVARLGSDDQKIVAGPMEKLLSVDFGPPLHCLIIVGETHPLEEEMLEFYMIK